MTTKTIPPRRPILPNSSPEVLKERRNKQGTLQVVWIEQIDAHGLFFTFADGAGTILLATHNNGHSCAALADMICSDDLTGAEAQRVFIADCGGTVCKAEYIAHTTKGWTL